MAVLVTGGAGYIGSHMVLDLLDGGEEVLVADNLSTGFPWAVAGAARLEVGDVGDAAFVGSLLRRNAIDTIIHFAGSVVVPESIENPLTYYRNNTCNSRTLIECAIQAGVRHFIFSSTAAVYGMPTSIPVSEDAPLEPISPYGSSKLMTEIVLRDAAYAHDLRYVSLRYFNVAGADPQRRTGQSTPRATHLIKVALEAALGRRPWLEVFGTDYPTPDGTCIRDYIHVIDLIAAHLAALQHLRRGGGNLVLNCGYGRGFSVLEVIEAVKKVTRADFDVRLGKRRAGDPAALVAETRRILEALDWIPRYDDLETIISHAHAWERRQMTDRVETFNNDRS
jgi:UDP-glucose 4-epimerase